MPTSPVWKTPATDHILCGQWRRSDESNKTLRLQESAMCLSIPAKSYGTWQTQSLPFKFTDGFEQSSAAITIKTILFLTSKPLEGVSQGSAGKQQSIV